MIRLSAGACPAGRWDVDDQQRFMTLFLRHQDDIRAFVGSVVRDWTATDDIMQETAVVLWRKFAEYDPSRSFGAWARGIAGFEIRKHRERTARVPALLSPEAIAAIDAVWDEGVTPASPRLEALARCLERVDAPVREIIALRYRDGLELDEVASRSGRGVEAVGKLLQRLRSALGECVRRQLAAGTP
jgi:RNA polymerase sigma-70 factor (ECF subfamily)